MANFWQMGVAYAQAQGATAQQPSLLEMLVMPAGFLLIMYFLVIRPQQKKAKDLQSLITALKPGDEVITNGGLIGRVKSVADAFITLEVAANTNIKVTRGSIVSLTKNVEAK